MPRKKAEIETSNEIGSIDYEEGAMEIVDYNTENMGFIEENNDGFTHEEIVTEVLPEENLIEELIESGNVADENTDDVAVEEALEDEESPIDNDNDSDDAFTGGIHADAEEAPDEDTQANASTNAPRSRGRRNQREQDSQSAQNPNVPSGPVLTLEVGGEVVTRQDKEDAVWHEIRNSRISGSILKGVLGKVEVLENGTPIALIDYKGIRIAIPMKEMMITLNRPNGQSDAEYNSRLARVLNKMMGAEIDFIVRGISGAGEERAAVASRKAAMIRLRQRYYLTTGVNGKPQIHPGRIVEARIVSVGQLAVRVEVFGVETTIRNRYLSWGYLGDARDEYYVGDTLQVHVSNITGETPETLSIMVDVRSMTTDDTRQKLAALKPQTNVIGDVMDIRKGAIFISLTDGVRAIAHSCRDPKGRKPGKGDRVLFVVTQVGEGAAIGLISRIIKRNI